METPNNYFDAWMKSQHQAFATLREQATQMQSFYQNSATSSDNPFAAWSKAAFDAFAANSDADLAKNTLYKSLGGTQAIQKLFEQWQPLLEAMRNNAVDPQAYKDLMDPAKVKQIVDQLFNFDTDALTQWQKQISQSADLYEQFGKPWADATKSQMGNFAQGDFQPETWLKQMQSMHNVFENSTGKLFSTPAVGKDREKMELMSQYAKAMSNYASKNVEYQRLMYDTGLKANETLAKELANRVQTGEKLEQFSDFFALWTEVNEKNFNELFQTTAFSQKRNALTEAGFNARKLYSEIVESQLVDLPIARRSEMDEVYKIVYELRKTVKNLESQIQELKSTASNNKEQQS